MSAEDVPNLNNLTHLYSSTDTFYQIYVTWKLVFKFFFAYLYFMRVFLTKHSEIIFLLITSLSLCSYNNGEEMWLPPNDVLQVISLKEGESLFLL